MINQEPTPPKDTVPPTAEGLPEEFELTPELVEEEAIRGDFVLRWAAVLLAFLVACTTISQTETLVHVKTGQYLASNGFVPDGTDPFAYTTEGRVWRNHSWLFDLTLAGVFGLGGALGLTIFKAFLAAVTFWLVVRLSRPQTPTWWNAMVAAGGAIACAPFFKATPEIVTLLGCALTLTFLNSWRYHGRDAINYKLPVLFFLWANFDPRMFLGLGLLLLYAAGESLRKTNRAEAPLLATKPLWMTVGACIAVTLLNPFGWHALTAPVELYGTVDPIFRSLNPQITTLDTLARYGLSHEGWWNFLTIPFAAALAIAGLAVISLYLNFSKLSLADLFVVPAFMALAYATGREIGPAVVVLCVVINLNSQDWYRESFTQTYSVRKGELLFSRGGRALTVLAFVGAAWITMKGFVFRGYQDAVGFGFDSSLANTLDGLREDLADQLDDRPFNFTASQGDTLIWVDQKVFLDSRLGLFAGEGEHDLIALHDKTRWSMRFPDPADERTGKPDVWKKTFNQFGITHVLPRLARFSGYSPDYVTYTMLMFDRNFQLTRLGPSTGIFYRTDLEDSELREYLSSHGVNFINQAFRSEQPEIGPRESFPQPKSVYDKYLRADRQELPHDVALASHYSQYLERAARGEFQVEPRAQLAFAYLSIRGCLRALAEPGGFDNPIAFRLLGQSYWFLQMIEANLCAQNGVNYDRSLRYYEAMFALRQSLVIEPDDLSALQLLREVYLGNSRLDLALETAERIEELLARDPQTADSATARQNREIIKQLKSQLDPVLEQVEKLIADKQVTRFEAAQLLVQNNHPHFALEYLDRAEIPADSEQQAALFRNTLLFEHGQLEASIESMLQLEEMLLQQGQPAGLRRAAWAYLASGDFASAISRWKRERGIIQIYPIKQILDTAPLVADEQPLNDDPESWFLGRYLNYAQSLQTYEESQATLWWYEAMAHLEAGDNEKATDSLKSLLAVAPDTQMRPFVSFYLLTIANMDVDPLPPSERIPISLDMFAGEPGTQSTDN